MEVYEQVDMIRLPRKLNQNAIGCDTYPGENFAKSL